MGLYEESVDLALKVSAGVGGVTVLMYVVLDGGCGFGQAGGQYSTQEQGHTETTMAQDC